MIKFLYRIKIFFRCLIRGHVWQDLGPRVVHRFGSNLEHISYDKDGEGRTLWTCYWCGKKEWT